MPNSPLESAAPTPKLSGRARLIGRLALSIVSISCVLGGLELAGYVWEQRTAQGPLGWTLVAARRIRFEQHGPSGRRYNLFVPHESYNWKGIPVHIGTSGFRTADFSLPKPRGTTRILNMGDSNVFGWGVRYEETYGKVLEGMLNKEGKDGRYEVINAGIPGWNPESERNFFLDRGSAYEPDLVIVAFTTTNDIVSREPAVSKKAPLFTWLRDHTYFWPFLTIGGRLLLSRRVGPESIPVLDPPRDASSYFPVDPESPAYDDTTRLLLETQRACETRKIPFVLVVFPTAFQVNSAKHPASPQRVLTALGAEHGFPVVDLLGAFKSECEALGEHACEGYANDLFADVWMHPNRSGHQIAADKSMPVVRDLLKR